MDVSNKKKNSKVAKGATLSRGQGPNFTPKLKKKTSSKSTPSNISEDYTILKPIPDSKKLPQIVNYLVSRGIAVDFYKEKYISRRLRVRMGRLGISTYEEYLAYLKRNTMELNQLKESLSINVTRFFRNRDTFDLLKTKIFPQISNSIKRNELSIWSAGCAVGAEPYSISIIAGEYFKKFNVNVRITATDVNEDLISIARSGVYSPPYLAELTESESRQYFMENSEGNYEVNPIVKSRVNFRKHDLTRDKYPTGFDMIICRNVLIYIDKDAQMEIISKFIDSLRPGGILVLGRTETLLTEWRHQVKTLSGIHRIYQKLDGVQLNEIKADKKLPRAQKFSRRKKTSPRKSEIPDTSKRISISSERVQNRLKELQDFKKRFDERKKQWEERMDTANKVKGSAFSSLSRASKRPNSRPISRTSKISSIPRREKNEQKKRRIDFKELLKPAKKPTRVSKIRKDDPLRRN